MPPLRIRNLTLALSILLLVACELTTTTPTPDVLTVTSTPEPLATETIQLSMEPSATNQPNDLSGPEKATEDFPSNINPLTGLPVADPAILDRYPVGVKISNFPRSVRPQWGLSLADIVYEYYHNNDLTRFYAIFYGQDAPLAGPIRSGRLFDSYLTDIYQSILVFASADPRVLDRLDAELPNWRLIPLLDGPLCPPRPVCRYQPDAENFLLTDTSVVGAYAAARGGDIERPDLGGMSFGTDVPPNGQAAARIFMYYSYSAYSYWDYDSQSGRYMRYQDTQEDLGIRGEDYAPLVDRLTGQQIAADNVVVLYIPHFHFFYKPATETEPIIEIVDMDFSGHALAYAFRDGQAYELEWVREEGQVLYLVDANGDRFPLKPGTTWFQVINEDSKLIPGEGAWRFEFVFRRP